MHLAGRESSEEGAVMAVGEDINVCLETTGFRMGRAAPSFQLFRDLFRRVLAKRDAP